MGTLLGGVGFFYVNARLRVIEVGYRVAEVEKQLRDLTREHERLRLETVVLRSPERVAALAERERKLMFPQPEQICIISRE